MSEAPYTVGWDVTGYDFLSEPTHDLHNLEEEIEAEGIDINGLGTEGPSLDDPPDWPTLLFTYDNNVPGNRIELPEAARPIVERHKPA